MCRRSSLRSTSMPKRRWVTASYFLNKPYGVGGRQGRSRAVLSNCAAASGRLDSAGPLTPSMLFRRKTQCRSRECETDMAAVVILSALVISRLRVLCRSYTSLLRARRSNPLSPRARQDGLLDVASLCNDVDLWCAASSPHERSDMRESLSPSDVAFAHHAELRPGLRRSSGLRGYDRANSPSRRPRLPAPPVAVRRR